MTSYLHAWFLISFSFIHYRKFTIALKKEPPLLSPISTDLLQEWSSKKYRRQLFQTLSLMIWRTNSKIWHTWCLWWWSDLRAKLLPNRTRFKIPRCSFSWDLYRPQPKHAGTLCPNQQATARISIRPSWNSSVRRRDFNGNWQRKTKDTVEEFENSSKVEDSLGSVNFNDFFTHPDSIYMLSISALSLKNMMERVSLSPPQSVWCDDGLVRR